MYPTIQLRWLTFSMTWLWIVAFLVMFIIIAKNRSNRLGLQFRVLLRHLPMILLLMYFLGTRTRYLFSDFIIIPLQPQQFLLYLSPYEYHFHLVWLLIWAVVWRKKFLQTQPRHHRSKWYAVLAESMIVWTIPLWIFLLLGDHFIGKPIEDGWFVSAIDPTSKVAAYDKVIPLGLYLSCIAGVVYLLTTLLAHRKKSYAWSFVGIFLYRVGIFFVLIRQVYARHLVMKRWDATVDIKQYSIILLLILIAREWWMLHRQTKTII